MLRFPKMFAPSTLRRVFKSARSSVSHSKAGRLEIALFEKQFRELRSVFPGELCDSDFRFKEPRSHPPPDGYGVAGGSHE